jgi:hypothetical protein
MDFFNLSTEQQNYDALHPQAALGLFFARISLASLATLRSLATVRVAVGWSSFLGERPQLIAGEIARARRILLSDR